MKKVLLIASNTFSKTGNNGKTYASILSRYPKSHLAQLYFSFNENPDFDICDNYYKISDIDLINSLKGKVTSGVVSSPLDKREVELNRKNKIVNFGKKYLSSTIRDILWFLGKWRTEKLLNWIQKFGPDVVFYVGGSSVFSNRIARNITSTFNIPLIVYYTDDYVVNSIKKNLFYYINKIKVNVTYQNTLKRSSLRYVIGKKMANVYEDYFGLQFKFIMNSVDVYPYEARMLNSANIVISYFGSLHSLRWKSIIKLAESLPIRCVIRVYTLSLSKEIIMNFSKHSNILLCEGIMGEKLRDAMKDSDYLLHVESDDKYCRRLTGLSISTKIPEYLISGRPIIAFGPQEVASMQLISENHIGYTIDSMLSDCEIKEILDKILLDKVKYDDLSRRGYDFAVKYFNKDNISQQVYNDIESL